MQDSSRKSKRRHLLTAVMMWAYAAGCLAQSNPAPLRLADVTREARNGRAEISAALARAEAAGARPAFVGALEDPMISPSVDHYPFRMMEDDAGGRRYDWSIAVEQRFPLSRVRRHRSRAATADADRAMAMAEQTKLDVELDAQRAFFMLRERRRMAEVLEQQRQLNLELVAATANRYASGTGVQADVLRAEAELVRAEAAQRANGATTRAAEAMLNTSMGRAAPTPVGELEAESPEPPLLPVGELLRTAMRVRPELQAGAAEIVRSAAETDVMRSMYLPMLTVRAGRASTMAEGDGAMLMIGVSVPLWRDALRARVSEARAMERMAASDLQAMQRMIEGEIASAFAEVESTREIRRSLAQEIIPRVRMAWDASLAAYGTGQLTLVSVLEASRLLSEARSELVMADTAASMARVRLDRAAGRTAARTEEP
jgi:outer membrane protein, heavy metal efflux system